MDTILVAIMAEIKGEALKEDINLARLKNLVEFALYYKSMAVDSVGDMSPSYQGNMLPVIGQPVAYAAPPMERLLGDLFPQALSLFETNIRNDTTSNIMALANSYCDLKGKEPELAAKLKTRLDRIIAEDEKEKEKNNETIHS